MASIAPLPHIFPKNVEGLKSINDVAPIVAASRPAHMNDRLKLHNLPLRLTSSSSGNVSFAGMGNFATSTLLETWCRLGWLKAGSYKWSPQCH
eukprot:1147695-Pelagomonas_calceolata.AAC.2